MALKIRLARGGSKKRPYYRIVVADARAPRDGLEPMIRPVEDANRLDEDEPGETLDRSVLGEIAPDGGRAFDGTFIRVPRVIDGGDGGGGGS